MSLVARHLEENGIATVIIGSARDIVEESGVPRFLFTDFPLGNPCGMPNDTDMQQAILESALELLARSWAPRTTVQSPFAWPEDSWRDNFMQVNDNNREKLALAGEERRRTQESIKEGVA